MKGSLTPEKVKGARALIPAFVIFLACLWGTFFAWKYLPAYQFPTLVLIAGVIFSFLLFGILYLLAGSSELRKFSKDLSIAKANAEQEQAKYEALLAGIGDGVVAVDYEGKIIFMNRPAEALLGWSATDAIGKMWHTVLRRVDDAGNPIPHETGAIHVALTSQSKATTTTAYYYMRKDGVKFPVAVTVSPVVISGIIVGAIDVFRDITKEKEVESAKAEFVSVASHQLRTPLGAIKWNLQLILGGDFGKISLPLKESLSDILTNNERLIAMVNDLLNVSRIETGKREDNPQETDVVEVIRSVVAELRVVADQRSVTIKFKAPTVAVPHIVIDARRLREVIQNLLSNAIKYNHPSGIVELTVMSKHPMIQIRVKDTGIGIPAGDRGKIFSKFFRSNNALRTDVEGTGLGLFVVRSYVERWSGKISFESEEGKGSTFMLEIPMKLPPREKNG